MKKKFKIIFNLSPKTKTKLDNQAVTYIIGVFPGPATTS